MRKLLVLNVVGLTPAILDGTDAPALSALAHSGARGALAPEFPALTCSSQTSMLTGTSPREHGIVGNGWYFRDLNEIWLWRQSNRLVQSENVWDIARRRDADFTVCNMFWWYNMNTSADSYMTPRPLYFADGRKAPGVYGRPLSFRYRIEATLGEFPLFHFWGPMAGLRSTQWIADATALAMEVADATLTLAYLPHLDYDFQRHGPNDPQSARAVREVDAVCAGLIEKARETGREVLVVSEYGIQPVSDAVHINRVLREAGFLRTTPMQDTELLDPGHSRAFAVADHQVAHVYVKNPDDVHEVQRVLEETSGIARVLDRTAQAEMDIDHPRSGDLIAISTPDRWFSYYYWSENRRAPDFARTVDIHSKPGYDPVELFTDPDLSMIGARIGWKLIKKKLGFRTLMDLIPLDTRLVRGSHGAPPDDPKNGPVFISSMSGITTPKSARDVQGTMLELMDMT